MNKLMKTKYAYHFNIPKTTLDFITIKLEQKIYKSRISNI